MVREAGGTVPGRSRRGKRRPSLRLGSCRAYKEAQYGGEKRRKPVIVLREDGSVRQDRRDDVGFKVLSREQSELVVSGAETSKLFTGW